MCRVRYPGRVDLTGRDVGDVGLKTDRYVADVGRRLAQVYYLLRHDDAVQHAAGQQFLRCRAAAAVPAKKGADRDDVGLDLPVRLTAEAGAACESAGSAAPRSAGRQRPARRSAQGLPAVNAASMR